MKTKLKPKFESIKKFVNIRKDTGRVNSSPYIEIGDINIQNKKV